MKRPSLWHIALVGTAVLLLTASCSTHRNTAKARFWHAFNSRYNTYFNGSQAFLQGSEELETGNRDNYTELLPLYPIGNKTSRGLGSAQFDRAIEKSEKVIKLHSIKRKPEWKPGRRKTKRDVEWLSRREYNPFMWKAWMLLGKSQFQKGEFEEAAATFSYMSRLYQTQPRQNGLARAWLAKSYTELGWLYDAEDVIRNMRRDSMDFRVVKDWDYTYADFYIRSGRYEEAIPYLQKVIKHERRKKLRARQWFILGQLHARLGHREEAYRAFRRVSRLNPPYELDFNARIAQTEVMAAGRARQMISRLRRMAASDNNKDYLDQVYYAMGNIYLTERDTLKAIAAYEQGNQKATRSGIEKGVLLLKLGNLYWQREAYSDARRCYGEAIGLLDRDRPDYEELSQRSKVLDELVPHTEAVHLQDSLQALTRMPEADRLAAIKRVIDDLKRREREAEDAEAERAALAQGAQGGADLPVRPGTTTQPATPRTGSQSSVFYFYNPQAVAQGKAAFERQWGKRDNVDDWQRSNRTVVTLEPLPADTVVAEEEPIEEPEAPAAADSVAADPHTVEYYLAQLPFTEEQLAASHQQIADGLFNGGIIMKDKLDNLRRSERMLLRLVTDYPDYSRNDEAWYHLYLLYARQGLMGQAQNCLSHLQTDYPESPWTTLLSNPYFAEDARFGVHMEDSLYAATYQAFRMNRHGEVKANTQLSESRYPQGAHRPKFIFIDGLSRLNGGDAEGCLQRMRTVVEDYPESEVSEMAGMIIKGVQQGRRLTGGTFDMGDVWSRRSAVLSDNDSTATDTLSTARDVRFAFVLAYRPDSIDGNQLLYELARYNFTNYLVRNFEIEVVAEEGLNRMVVRGFLNYDEARQYVRMLYADAWMNERLRGCRHLVISEENLPKLGISFSYNDYDEFFERELAPVSISDEELLSVPETIEEAKEPETETPTDNPVDDLFDDTVPAGNDIEFDEDFYR